jgi:hypothetical protein
MKVNDLIDPFICLKNLAFLPIPKNATSSIKLSFLVNSSNVNEEQREILKKYGLYPFNAGFYFPRNPRGDLSFGLYENFINVEGDLSSYFSFTFLRNPYNRFLSFYKDKALDASTIPIYYENLKEFKGVGIFEALYLIEKCIYTKPLDEINHHYLPQSFFIKNKIDFFGTVENIEKDWEIIEENIGFKIPLYYINTFDPNKAKINIDANTERKIRDRIYHIYKSDYKLLESVL